MNINKLVVLGGGVLGSQIAYQSAYSGIPTVIYDISDDAVDAAKLRVATYLLSFNAISTRLIPHWKKPLHG
ncbi:3-hydroxyacyl-CoA dehydrogenase NAD-binding domain-containing protein [Secundilactobacillus paracollinoides]|uniref:3-hydroxyacyl-CoA dehydrogenase NAD-binding domain-containing protein n=1 Tax=Secundilactobacillus paracollinoides TaxID=240427 RepID=UPI0006CFB040|nr:3-hydroxyacyl-CoA dehydrogenase NAD-binding domain-containing protein [Secundilactobacillus paracollinoides]